MRLSSILTSPTTITDFIRTSLGPDFSGCGGVSDARIPLFGRRTHLAAPIVLFL